MSVLIFLIPIALMLSLVGLIAFIWSMKSKQFDDLDGNASRILFDDSKDEISVVKRNEDSNNLS